MPSPSPPPLSPAALRVRRNRIARLAEKLGFVGRVEYRHVYSRTGGATYGQAATADQDLLVVYVEAFERDINPAEFSLERYQPMGRLLGDEDLLFLKSQPGYRSELGSRWERERRRIFRLYLTEL